MHKQNKVPTCVLSVHLAQALRDAQLDTATRLPEPMTRPTELYINGELVSKWDE